MDISGSALLELMSVYSYSYKLEKLVSVVDVLNLLINDKVCFISSILENFACLVANRVNIFNGLKYYNMLNYIESQFIFYSFAKPPEFNWVIVTNQLPLYVFIVGNELNLLSILIYL